MSHARLVLRAVSCVLAAALVITSGTSPSSAAEQHRRLDNASIFGTVTGINGERLGNVVVSLFNEGSYDAAVAGTRTAPEGTYTFADLPAGRYRVGYIDLDAQEYAPEFWNDATSPETAETIVVGESAIVVDIDAELSLYSHITGTVTDPSGAPLPEILVSVLTLDVPSGSWVQPNAVTTDANGFYDAGRLMRGPHRLEFSSRDGSYVREFWDDSLTLDAADDIEVGKDTTVSGKDAQLATPSHLTGTITAPGGAPINGAEVTAFTFSVQAAAWVFAGEAATAADGAYDIGGLSAGTYRLRFSEGLGNSYLREFFDDAPTLEAAQDIVVGPSQTVGGNDAELATPSHITGTITAAGGAPLSNVKVTAYTYDAGLDSWVVAGLAFSDESGVYDMEELTPDTYRIGFERGFGNEFLPEFFDDASTVESATDIVVGLSETVAGTDAVLAATSPVSNTAPPTITGAATVGSTLTATAGTWNPSTGLTFAYQWFADDAAITGATNTTYTVAAGDLGKPITVRVTATNADGASGNATSAATAPASNQTPVMTTAVPTITGSAVVGHTLNASYGTWNPDTGLTFAYQWFADDTVITGATNPTYVLVPGDVAKPIKVRVTASRDGNTSGTATSAATAAVTSGEPNLSSVTRPRITGTAQVGRKLTASNGTWTPSTGLTFTYQWKVNGVAQPGAMAATYQVPPTAVRKRVTVTVTAARGDETASATSLATAAVTPGTLALRKAPTFTGRPKVGKILTASPGATTPVPSKVTFQWLRDGDAISKATGNKYRLTSRDKGKKISVEVTYTRTGYRTLVTTAGPTSKVT